VPEHPEAGWTTTVKRRFLGVARQLGRFARGAALFSTVTLVALSAVYPSAGALPAPLLVPFAAALFALPAALLAWLTGWVAQVGSTSRAAVSASAEGLRVNGRLTAFEDIAHGLVVPEADAASARVTTRAGTVLEIAVPSVEEADALLEALELGPEQRRTYLRWRNLAQRTVAGGLAVVATIAVLGMAAGAVAGSSLSAAVGFLLFTTPFLAAGAAARATDREVEIGVDGLHARSLEGRIRARFEDLAEVHVHGQHVELLHRDGTRARVPVDVADQRTGQALARRIVEALRAFQEARGSRAHLFARGADTLDAWRARLGRLLRGDAGFRGAVVRVADAERVLADPEAVLEARVGAALALQAADGDEGRRRIRVALEGTVRPEVRVVLEAAERGEVDEAALEAAGADPARRAQAR
jgi:hypothetical protein